MFFKKFKKYLKYIHREIAEIVCEFGGQRGGKRNVSLPSDHQTRGFISAFSRWIGSCMNFKTKWLTSGGFFSNYNSSECGGHVLEQNYNFMESDWSKKSTWPSIFTTIVVRKKSTRCQPLCFEIHTTPNTKRGREMRVRREKMARRVLTDGERRMPNRFQVPIAWLLFFLLTIVWCGTLHHTNFLVWFSVYTEPYILPALLSRL